MSFDFSLAEAQAIETNPENTAVDNPTNKEEDKKLKIDMSLDEIAKQEREEYRAQHPQHNQQRKPLHRDKHIEKPIYKYLNLTEREIRNYTNQAEIDTDGYDVRLRLVLTRK